MQKNIANNVFEVLFASLMVWEGLGIWRLQDLFSPPIKYRLMEKMGEKIDVAFSYKVQDPRVVWEKLARRVRELNP